MPVSKYKNTCKRREGRKPRAAGGQAVCFRAAGAAWVPAKPWAPHIPGRWARGAASDLPEAARQHLSRLEASSEGARDGHQYNSA